MKKDSEVFLRCQLPCEVDKTLDYLISSYNKWLTEKKSVEFILFCNHHKLSKSRLVRFLVINFFYNLEKNKNLNEYELIERLEKLERVYTKGGKNE